MYIVGAGPGNPDLITLRGRNILREAEVVVYDYLVDKGLLKYAKEEAELFCCNALRREERRGVLSSRRERLNSLLIRKAQQGKTVVRLKGGDPSIFSQASHELEALIKAKIEFEIVPGVTAASAASSFTGIPLTDRQFASDCVFVTGKEELSKIKSSIEWDSVSKIGTMVFYMAIANLRAITKQLMLAGRDKKTPVAIIQSASLPTQKIVIGTLNNIIEKVLEQSINSPAIVIIGEVVKFGRRFNWIRKNKRILFTGLSQERFFLKGTYVHLPLIKIESLSDYKEFDHHIKNIAEFSWIVFTSRYGVNHFFKRLRAVGYDTRKLACIKAAAIGESTKRKLLEYGIMADLIPKKESSFGLIREFRKVDLKGKRIFFPQSNFSDKGMGKALKRMGAEVIASIAYKNTMPDDLPDLDLNNFDEIMFTSPSTVRNFKKRYKKVPKNVRIKCIGEVTLKEANRCKLLG